MPDDAKQSPAAADGATSDEPGSPFVTIPLEITVCVGRARPRVRDLLRLGPGSVLPLDRTVEDPVELFVGERLIARGELIEGEDGSGAQLAVRLTNVAADDDQI